MEQFGVRHCPTPEDFSSYKTRKIRETFVIEELFGKDEIRLTYTHFDRMVVVGIMPVDKNLVLEPVEYMKTEYFNKDRETGVINVGGTGHVSVDGEVFSLGYKEALYVGRGVKDVSFSSDDAEKPARFYLNSCLAHRSCQSVKVTREEANPVYLGTEENINVRTLNQYIVPGIVDTCQLMMGITEVKEGNAWNTMPCHIHRMRMEAYFYFEIPEDQAVCHIMGEPDETRHIWVHNENVVLSPDWSLHAAAGTCNYSFVWGMAGTDGPMDPVPTKTLR